MTSIITATLVFDLYLPGCTSLKEKRSRLKPLLARLHREFNVSSAELDWNDTWQSARIGCAVLGNNAAVLQQTLQTVERWVEKYWPDVQVVDTQIMMR